MTTAVSGKAFLGLIRYVKETHGAEKLERVVAAGGPELAQVFASRIRVSDWHPYAVYAAFLQALDKHVGGKDRDFLRKLGAHAGERDLGTIFRVYVALASPERLIRSCSKVWPSYYRGCGQMEAVAWSPDDTRLVISGFSQMVPEHCKLMEGWMIQTMKTLGCVVSDDAHEAVCQSRGGPYHEFVCTWTRG